MKIITIADVKFIAHELAKKMMTWDEPIPDFQTRFKGILESCLRVPFQKSLHRKAAILFYLMVKNHPFQNGNKRIAVTALFVFLWKNKKWIRVDNQELYNFAVWVAQSPPRLKREVIAAIERFLLDVIVDRK